MSWETPSEYAGFDKATPSPQDVSSFHQNSDKDSSSWAQHHTLGLGPNQAASGDHEHLVGSVYMYLGLVVPEGYLGINGQMFNGLLYPKLAAVVGEIYGAKSGDFYRLPTIAGRSPIGVGIADSGSMGNNYSLGLKWGHEGLQSHTHLQDPHSHATFINTALINARVDGGAEYNTDSGGNTPTALTTATNQSTGSGNMGNVHPVLCLNFIVRAL